MQAQLGEQYNRLVKQVYVVELTGGEIPTGVIISSTDSFEGYTVKVLQAGELVDWTGKYSYTNAKLILALLVEPKMSITESGFTAETTDPLGFPEDVTLTVTEITDTEELKEKLGDNYNSRIKKVYVIELKQGEQKYPDETVKIYVDKAFANDLLVYLLKDTPELQTPTDRYELEGTEITLILEEKITPPVKEETKQDNWKPWMIVGIIFGIYLLLLLLLIILLIIKRKKREKMQNQTLKK